MGETGKKNWTILRSTADRAELHKRERRERIKAVPDGLLGHVAVHVARKPTWTGFPGTCQCGRCLAQLSVCKWSNSAENIDSDSFYNRKK